MSMRNIPLNPPSKGNLERIPPGTETGRYTPRRVKWDVVAVWTGIAVAGVGVWALAIWKAAELVHALF